MTVANQIARVVQAARGNPGDSIVRSVAAIVRAEFDPFHGSGADGHFQKLFPRDESGIAILRAATTPATIGASAWAGVLASTVVADFISNLGPVSAASELIKLGLVLNFDKGSVSVPGIVASAGGSGFVEEGQPIPVRAGTVSAVTLTPKKLAVISAFTRELSASSQIEKMVRTILAQNTALALDGVFFGTAAASAAAPAGIRNGIAALTATAGGTADAMRKDISQLAAAVAPVAGGQIVFVASPDAAVKLALNANPELPYPVLSSSGLAAGTVVAVAVNALAVAVDAVPKIEASKQTTLHMDDAPLAIGTAGTPNTVAAPSRSMFQTDTTALRLILSVNWGLRATGAVAWVTGITW